MTVTIANSTNGSIRTYTGTLQEVINALEADGIPGHKYNIIHNGTNYDAIVKRN